MLSIEFLLKLLRDGLKTAREQKLLARYGKLESAAIRNSTSGNLRSIQAKQELTH
jgi:hypothetical protein